MNSYCFVCLKPCPCDATITVRMVVVVHQQQRGNFEVQRRHFTNGFIALCSNLPSHPPPPPPPSPPPLLLLTVSFADNGSGPSVNVTDCDENTSAQLNEVNSNHGHLPSSWLLLCSVSLPTPACPHHPIPNTPNTGASDPCQRKNCPGVAV